MAKPTGFIEFDRETAGRRSVEERLRDYRDVYEPLADENLVKQAARCMDCGVPFCHSGCPVGNVIPDFNDLVYREQWQRAIETLHATNNFPEFTGRVCPAPCEEACVLGITKPPVTIKQIELRIVERAFKESWVRPQLPKRRTGKQIAIVGSGPAGLACAQQLNRAGHTVTVYERADRIGGLLRYGIPDFKLEKQLIDRRLALMEAEGVIFRANVDVGRSLPTEALKDYDAVVLCGGATRARDLDIPGRELAGIHFAMDLLWRQNKTLAGDDLGAEGFEPINAAGMDVIVIGGGDTGSDCVGTANRHGAKSVTQFELLSMPPLGRPENQPWPYWPMKLRSSTSHDEGGDRMWGIATTGFVGEGGHVSKVRTVHVEFVEDEQGGRLKMQSVAGSDREYPADLVLLAMGFVGPAPEGLLGELGVELDERGNVRTDADYMTSVPGVFGAGDMRRGQSLVVWGISEGREAAVGVDRYLMAHSSLPTKGPGDLPRR